MAMGPYGLFLLAILDSAGLPVVGGVDALLIAQSIARPHLAYIGAIWAVFGSLAGSLILFGIARKGGEVLLARQLATRRGQRLHTWFERYGLATVFIPAVSPLPLPMKVPVFCAGALEVHWSYFSAVVLVARAIRYFALAYLALHFGRETFHFLASHILAVVFIAIGVTTVAIFGLQWVERRHSAPSKSATVSK